ncbi:MAG: hypothetical protein JW901_05390 [Dehalococcoidia bacterium]|nr:hypothetical protein [Dehalococcoidia bacterium]
MAELPHIEPLWEIKRLMSMTPGRFKHFKERGPGMTAPIRHNENWVYWCPICEKNWEGELYHEAYFVPCMGCREKETA